MDFLDPVDVLAKLPASFNGEEGTESKKWQERKDALQALLDLLTANPCLEPKANYGEIVSQLNKMLGKDANINVAALAAKCLLGIANGLGKKFGPHAATVLPTIFDKFKEKKPMLRLPLCECIDAVFATTTLEAMEEPLLAALDNKNPQIKAQTDQFLYRAFKKLNAQTVPKKTLKALVPVLIKHTADADVEVREGAMAALGSAMRVVGQAGANTLLKDISEDKTKMNKINEYTVQATEEYSKEAAANAPPVEEKASSASSSEDTSEAEVKSSGDSGSGAAAAPAKEEDPFEFLDPFDLVGKLPAIFYGEEGTLSKKWQERKDALQAALDLMTANPKLEPKSNYGELVSTLARILAKDANINVCALAAKCLAAIAKGLRKKFAPHVPSVIVPILDKFKEKKPVLKDPLVECIDAVGATVGLEALEEPILAAMENKNPQIKAQVDQYLCRTFKTLNQQTMPKKTLKALTPLLVKHTSESDSEIRESSYSALGAAMRIIGEKAICTLCAEIAEDKLKMTKVKEYCQKIVDEVGACVSAAPAAPPQAAKKQEEKKAPAGKPPAAGAKKKPPTRPTTPVEVEEEVPSRPPSAAEKRPPAKKESPKQEEEKKATELLAENNDKAQRLKDEATLKILKWNFTTPTDEHIQQLNTLLSQYAKTSLLGNLFSNDFKMHLKAIDDLNKAGDVNPAVLVSNSDLLLKWCTLRFFETNPAALIKTLELCLRIVRCCADVEESMSTSELTSFLPYLILKSGEQKENMRMVVRDIVDELTSICGPFKMAPLVLEGLKTKNARQRTEVLMVLEKFIAGGALGQLKALGPLKIVAACVGDADKNVRSAAINTLVAAYRVDGDAIWKQTGRMSDKDRAMVDERIKRAGAVPGSAVVPPPVGKGARIVKETPSKSIRGRASSATRTGSRPVSPEDSDDANVSMVHNRTVDRHQGALSPDGQLNTTTIKHSSSQPMFSLDDEFLSSAVVHARAEREERMSSTSNYLNRMEQGMRNPDDFAVSRRNQMKRTNSASSIASSVETLEQLDKTIQDIASSNFQIARDAISQLSYITQFPEQVMLLHERIDTVLQVCAMQLECTLKSAAYTGVPRACDIIRSIYNFIHQAYATSEHNVLQHASTRVVESLIAQMVNTVSSRDLVGADEEFSTLAKAANVVVLRFCKLCKPAVFFEAVVNNLISMGPKKEEEWSLLLKILYRFIQSLGDVNFVMRTDLRQFFMAASSLCNFLTSQPQPHSENVREATDQLFAAIEGVVTVVREQALDAVRRISHPHPKVIDSVNRIIASVKDQPRPELPNLPGQVESPVADFSIERMWSLLHHIGADFTELQRSLPPLAEYYQKYSIHQPVMQLKIQQYYNGKQIWKLMENYMEMGERCQWPDQRLGAIYNQSRDLLLTMGEQFWGERANPLVRRQANGDVPPMMSTSTYSTTSELPPVVVPDQLPQPTPKPQIKKPARRSVFQKPELDDFKNRLANIGK